MLQEEEVVQKQFVSIVEWIAFLSHPIPLSVPIVGKLDTIYTGAHTQGFRGLIALNQLEMKKILKNKLLF